MKTERRISFDAKQKTYWRLQIIKQQKWEIYTFIEMNFAIQKNNVSLWNVLWGSLSLSIWEPNELRSFSKKNQAANTR